MTAHDLIADIFRRQQLRNGDECWISQAQCDWLRRLIDADEEGGAVKSGANGSFFWLPKGRTKYLITPPAPGQRSGKLSKYANLVPSDMGSLF